MQKLRALWKKDPGLFVSVGAHALALVALVLNFSSSPTIPDSVESIPVEMVTTSDLNQIMNGEETAKQLPKPQRRVDKVADLEEHHPAPPLAEAKKDTPTPPSPDAPNTDPGEDEKSTPAAAAPPPPPPTPPERPVEKAEAPMPPPKPEPKPEPVKPPPPDAEALAQKAPPPPPLPPQRPAEKPVKEAKAAPTPPQPPRKPEQHDKSEPKKDSLDQVAKLLAEMKPPKPQKARAGSKTLDAEKHSDFNLDKITALLDHEAAQRKASTGRSLTQVASLGTATGHSEKMSPSMMAQLDGWLIDHYRGCWSYFGLGATQDYVPSVRVRMAPDGSLIGEPALLNPPTDPNLRSLADSAIRAVNRCNPMPVPERFKPYYDAWRLRVVRFDPKEMS